MELEHAISLLTRFPAALNALLRDLPESWTARNEGGETWTAYDTVRHLVHLERRHWIPRIQHLLQFGDTNPFDPVQREPHEQENRQPLGELLDEFARLRSENIAALSALHLSPEQLALRGRHPAFGSVALSELLATWTTHDLTHLHQISRVLAHQYRDAVGPWSAYLGVLRCTAHGD